MLSTIHKNMQSNPGHIWTVFVGIKLLNVLFEYKIFKDNKR